MIGLALTHVNENDKKNHFMVKPHQCLIASWLATRTEQCAYAQVDYGHGKSFVTLLTAEYLVKYKNAKAVYIITVNDELVK